MTEEGKKAVRKKVIRKSSVRVIKVKDGRALVEWVDRKEMLCRAFVGVDEIADERVANSVLSEAIPYGVPWEGAFEEAEKVSTPEFRANELRKAGIWTHDDLRTKSVALLGALKAGFRVEIGELNALATKVRGGE